MKKSLAAFGLTAALCLTPVQTFASFHDLNGGSHEQAILKMVENGVMKGDGTGNIYPNRPVTRGQFALMLYRALDLEPYAIESNAFHDLGKDPELIRAVNTLHHYKIVNGFTKGEYRPTVEISRQHAAAIIDRVLTMYEVPTNVQKTNYIDRNHILESYQIAVDRVSTESIIKGIPTANGVLFSPNDYTKRGQFATIVSRLQEKLVDRDLPAILDPKPSDKPEENPSTKPEEKPSDKPEEKPSTKPEEKPNVKPEEKPEEKPVEKPTPVPTGFQLVYIQNGSLKPDGKVYSSYTEAAAKLNQDANAVGFMEDGFLVRVKDGVAYAGLSGATTRVFEKPNFKKQLTYMESGREFELLEQTEKYIKVKVGDTVGYAQPRDVGLVPKSLVAVRDHYTVNQNNNLVHHTANHLRKTTATYEVGPAPSTFQKGVKYYSTDGVHFTSEHGAKVTHYPYFQFQSFRTETPYTAEELDQFIMDVLQQREALNLAAYKDATVKSKIIGLGDHLKKVEKEHRVNALFILATAIHESNYGMSVNAQTKNNLFGIRVFDSTPEAGEKYEIPEASVDAFIREYMNKNYGMPQGAYANGAAPGNKTIGANVMYASDPTWGAKINAHMWRADRALGGKEMNLHQLGMTRTSEEIIVYRDASESSDELYRYKARSLGHSGNSGYPVVILEEKNVNGHKWYRIVSDDIQKENEQHITDGWVQASHIRQIK